MSVSATSVRLSGDSSLLRNGLLEGGLLGYLGLLSGSGLLVLFHRCGLYSEFIRMRTIESLDPCNLEENRKTYLSDDPIGLGCLWETEKDFSIETSRSQFVRSRAFIMGKDCLKKKLSYLNASVLGTCHCPATIIIHTSRASLNRRDIPTKLHVHLKEKERKNNGKYWVSLQLDGWNNAE